MPIDLRALMFPMVSRAFYGDPHCYGFFPYSYGFPCFHGFSISGTVFQFFMVYDVSSRFSMSSLERH